MGRTLRLLIDVAGRPRRPSVVTPSGLEDSGPEVRWSLSALPAASIEAEVVAGTAKWPRHVSLPLWLAGRARVPSTLPGTDQVVCTNTAVRGGSFPPGATTPRPSRSAPAPDAPGYPTGPQRGD